MLVEDPRAAEARQAAGQGLWERAAELWTALADDLMEEDAGAAVQALSLSADAWRREDRPVVAAVALRRALAATGDGPGRALLHIQLAAVLADAGQLMPALDIAHGALDAAASPGEQALAADLASGLALELGRIPLAVELLGLLRDPRARAFRAAVVYRVTGRLARASAELSIATEVVGGRPELAGLRAALHHEEGELALVVGDPADALTSFLAARSEWEQVRRRSGLFHAIAGEVRARLALDTLPLPAELDRGVDYAVDRGLVMVEQDLLLARGAARARAGLPGADQDLGRAVDLAAAVGAGLAEGRARQVRMELGCAEQGDAEAVERLLVGTCWA